MSKFKKLLYDAIIAGNLRRVKKLVKELDDGKGVSETIGNAKDIYGRGPLHLAAQKGKLNVCNYLLQELKLNVNQTDVKGHTALHCASKNGHLSTVICLIENGADPDASAVCNATPLHLATSDGNIEIIQVLLSKGADVNALSGMGAPLQLATLLSNLEAFKTLLDNGANPNVFASAFPSPLHNSISTRSLEYTKCLLQAGADPNGISCGETPLGTAAKRGEIDFIRCLLEGGADPNTTDDMGLKPIELAAQNGYHQDVEYLFSVTSCIPTCSDWSVTGLMKYVHSEQAKKLIKLKGKEVLLKAKSKGEDALKRKGYLEALYHYNEALTLDPTDVTSLSKRSLCFACIGAAEEAWLDAKACIKLWPEWPEAYYRGGSALILLENFEAAADTFSLGLKLDPQNKELQDALNSICIF